MNMKHTHITILLICYHTKFQKLIYISDVYYLHKYHMHYQIREVFVLGWSANIADDLVNYNLPLLFQHGNPCNVFGHKITLMVI